MNNKLPAIMFYPGDWLREPGLMGCSIAAQGLWFRLLLMMHDSPERGKIRTNLEKIGRVISLDPITPGEHESCVLWLVVELFNGGVCEIDFDSKRDHVTFWGKDDAEKSSIWFELINRRMYREWLNQRELSSKRAEAGKKGAQAKAKQRPSKGSAKCQQTASKTLANFHYENPGKTEANGKQNQALSSSSSSSSSISSSISDSISEKKERIGDCPEPEKTGSGPATPQEIFLDFPTFGKEKSWGLTKPKVEEYRQAFPGLDIEAECRKALQWLRDNPSRAKTASGMPRFLFSWMERSQNRGGHNGRVETYRTDRIAGSAKPIAGKYAHLG